eukprot:714254-Pyramimonas_sp.AAC.1
MELGSRTTSTPSEASAPDAALLVIWPCLTPARISIRSVLFHRSARCTITVALRLVVRPAP